MPDVTTCGHPKAVVYPYGLARCPECAAVRGVDFVWRVPEPLSERGRGCHHSLALERADGTWRCRSCPARSVDRGKTWVRP